MSAIDMIIGAALKSLDIDALMQRPDIQNVLKSVEQIAADFRVIREKVENTEALQIEILRRLDAGNQTVDNAKVVDDRLLS